MDKKIEQKLDKIRKVLQADGGDLKVKSYNEKKKILKVELLGMCQGCPMAEITVKGFIEKELQKDIPKIKVESI